MLSNAKGVLIFGVPGLKRFQRRVLNVIVLTGILLERNDFTRIL
jgi:hypothetical protein